MNNSFGNARSYFPIFALGAIVSIGAFWSFQRGGQDFSVFYEAWKLVVGGQGAKIYVESPDRFLYAPGFAWVLSPLGLFSKTAALALWDLAKALVIYGLVQAFGTRIFEHSRDSSNPVSIEHALAIAAWGFLLIARPLLIDFQYGQVNTFILGVSAWALLSYFSENNRRRWLGLSWFLLGIAAVSKLFALPLLMVPYFKPRQADGRIAKLASAAGVLVAAGIPMMSMGVSGALDLIFAWRQALIAKGLPFESHNQSFIALLDHYFTNTPTHVIALGWNWVVLGRPYLGMNTITELSLAWAFAFLGVLVAWIVLVNVRGARESLRWTAVVISLLFIPSYLVWKPYFVLSYPLAVLLIWQYGRRKKWLIALGFVAMNLTGFDLMGGYLAARIEAASVFLLVHLAYLACVLWARPDSELDSERLNPA